MVQFSLDTSHTYCAVALSQIKNTKLEILASESRQINKGHAEILINMCDRALSMAKLDIAELTQIAVTTGPGSFTGLRAGIACARALALALKINAVGVSVLDALITQSRDMLPLYAVDKIGVILNAKHRQYYMQVDNAYADCLIPACIVDQETINSHIKALGPSLFLLGSDMPELPAIKGAIYRSIRTNAPDIKTVAALGHQRATGTHPVDPLYLRPPDIKPQKQGLFHSGVKRL